MNVRLLDKGNTEEVKKWDDFTENHNQLYHHTKWAEIISSSYGFKPYYLYIEDDREIKSVFPLLHVKIPLLKDEIVSIPHLESGGMINTEFYNLYFDFISQYIRVKKIRICQFKDNIGDFSANTNDVIMIKDLPQEKERIISGIKAATTRNYMRRILEKDFEVTTGNSIDDLTSLYKLYLQRMREFGTPPHGFSFLKKIVEGFKEKAIILLVKTPERVAGAALYILFNEYLYNLLLVVPRRYLKEKIVYLLQYKAMELGIENKLKHLVLGRSTKDSGTYFYKSELGGKPIQIYLYNFTLTPDGYKAEQEKTVKEKYEAGAHIWSRLPSFFTDCVGPKLRKWIY